MILSNSFDFEASHSLPSYEGNEANLHGHSFKLRVYIKGMPDPDTGMVMDSKELNYMVRKYAIDKLAHKHLNEILDIPTPENIIVFIWNELILQMPNLDKLELWETTNKVEYKGIRKEELIDSETTSTGSGE